jgi:hypothetical protein
VNRTNLKMFGVALALACGDLISASPTTYDVTTDWRNNLNPNGVWSYDQGSTPLPFQSNFGSGTCDAGSVGITGAYAPGINFGNSPPCLPIFFKATGNAANPNDWLAGDVLIHAQDPSNGAGEGQATLVWTAPANGTFTFTGAIWYAHSTVQRSDDFSLNLGSTILASGTVAFNSAIGNNRSNMAKFSGTFAVLAGQQVTLLIQRTPGSVGALVGVQLSITQSAYYFSQLALGGGWQTTLTYINYSPQAVTCVTNFFADSGAPLLVPFGGGTVSSRTDTLQPGGSFHDESKADLSAPVVQGWAQAVCNGPIKASLLYRLYQQGAPVGEAGVNAMTAPATKFATFAETRTGVAYANPSATQSALVTFTVVNTAGVKLGSTSLVLLPGEHGAKNLGPLLGLQNFVGFVEITSSVPIVSLSLNFEAFPVFSSLPAGELSDSTALLFP